MEFGTKVVRSTLILGALALAMVSFEGHADAQSTDTKQWSRFTGRVELSKLLRLDLGHQIRLSSNNGVEKSLSQAKLRIRAHRYLRLGGAYRLTSTGESGVYHRFSGDVGTGLSLGKISLAYRFRYQSESRPMETANTLRNKFGVSLDTDTDFTPRAAFEIHYSSTKSEFRENRFILGVNWKFSKRMRFDAFYQFQSEYNKRNDEINHVFGVGMTYYFKRLKKKKDKKKVPAATPVL